MSASESEGASTIRGNISRNWPNVRRSLAVYLTFFLLICLVVFAFFFNRIFITIHPGHAGVLWQRFHGGTNLDRMYGEGFHIIPPWDRMYIYDLRVQHRPFEFEALSRDGLTIKFEVSTRFYPTRNYVPLLHKYVGPDYIDKVVGPETQAHIRKVVANYLPEEIYTSEGYLLQIIMQGAMGAFAEKYVVLDNLLIRRMTLPKTIVDAIERKLTREQYLQEFNYRLLIEEKEARRKGIEAEGIRRFQDIVKASDFFDKYLQFKGIDATLSLAQSDNSKVVVIGGGGSGSLPLIMNMESGGGISGKRSAKAVGAEQTDPLSSLPEPQALPDPNLPSLPAPESEGAFFSRLQQYIGNQGQPQLPAGQVPSMQGPESKGPESKGNESR